MAASRRKSKRRAARTQRRNGRTAETRRRNGAQRDAIALLKADHRQVEDWFEQFEKARSDDRKQDLAAKICAALKAHTTIEEEIFYPAFLEATEEMDLHHEAEVEHEGAKNLIAQIEAADPTDDYYDAKVSVLSEMIKHHVKEEEKPGGMFAKARQSDMDLESLGARLRTRKEQLVEENDASDSPEQRELGAAMAGQRQRAQQERRNRIATRQ